MSAASHAEASYAVNSRFLTECGAPVEGCGSQTSFTVPSLVRVSLRCSSCRCRTILAWNISALSTLFAQLLWPFVTHTPVSSSQTGYAYVQVSPATEHITGDSWWTDYQKVSNQLISKRGSRDEFSNMVTTCNNAGVGVLVDAIWNHMAGSDSGTGVAGTCEYATVFACEYTIDIVDLV